MVYSSSYFWSHIKFICWITKQYNNTLYFRLYKPIFGKRASDQHIARVGHIATVVIGIIVVGISPLIALFPSGLYAIVQQFNGVYSMPVLALVLVAFYSKHTSKLGAKVALVTHCVICCN